MTTSKKIALLISLFMFINNAYAKQKIIVNDVSWPPYFFIDQQFSLQGLGKDLLNMCIAQTGYQVEYRHLPVKRTHLYMQEGSIDVTVYSYKKAREQFLVYGQQSLFNSEYGFMVRADSDIEINKLADLAPYTMGHLAGLTYTPQLLEIIQDKQKNNQLTVGYNLKSMFSQLLAPTPRFEIMADSKITFYWQAKKLGVSDKIKVLDYTIKRKSYFITVSKKSKHIKDPQAFINSTDQCLKTLKDNGKYKAVLQKYGVTD